MRKKAFFSDDGKFRYQLYRIWDESLPIAMCVGLNPSTANSDDNDPTINKLIMLMKNNGYGGFHMVNLFALISPYPEDLSSHPNPINDADKWNFNLVQTCDSIIFCWGNFKQAEHRAKKYIAKYPDALCFGKNNNGSPKHPLYLKGTTELQRYAPQILSTDARALVER
jgi:hypothetical protein